MSLALPLTSPLYEGGGMSALVPGLWDVALAGRPYMIDWKYADEFIDQSIKLLKPQQDSSGVTSEASLNPEDFPRRGIESWHKGAGQVFFDRPDSDPSRFRSSKGVYVWERWELSPLPTTSSQTSSAATNLAVETAGAYLYEVDDQQVYWRSTIGGARTSAVIHNGEAAQSVKSIASDGYYLYAALGSNGIHRTVAGASTASHFSDLSCTLIGYEKGRLMAANGAAIYNVTAAGAAPSALYTHPNTDFAWVGFASGLGVLYAAGFSGDKSLVYRTAVLADGTALAIPVIAGQLPDGEIIRSIKGYLNFVLLGTDQGVRFAIPDDAGNLTVGALIDLGVSVRCFEGQDRFVWFGWTNYDGTSTGLGRLDLSELNGSAPAYASDLMVTGQGTVLSVCTFADKRVFAVSGLGIYAEATTPVASATIASGLITFGFPDPKVAMFVDLRHEALAGSVATSIASDGGSFVALSTSDEEGSTSKTFTAGQGSADTHELRLTLTPSGFAPVVTRLTLEANPSPGRGEFFAVPLLLTEAPELANGSKGSMDPAAEKAALVQMEVLGQLITFQDGTGAYSVLLDDHQFLKQQYTKNRDGWNGTMVVRLRNPRARS